MEAAAAAAVAAAVAAAEDVVVVAVVVVEANLNIKIKKYGQEKTSLCFLSNIDVC